MRIILISILALIVGVSCSTDLDINAEYKEITIVYGLMDLSDTPHYVKINKAFLNESQSALVVAKIPDSLYHSENLRVILEEYVNFNKTRNIVLETQVVPKEEGVFAGPNQTLYRVPANVTLREDASYELYIKKANSGEQIAGATTNIVGNVSLTAPKAGSKIPLSAGNDGYRFYNFEWTNARNASMYEVFLRFRFDEVNKVSNDTVPKYLDFVITPNFDPGNQSTGSTIKFSVSGEKFFDYIASVLEADANIERIINPNGEVHFAIAAEDLATLIEVSRPDESLTQVKPEFTNIAGGLGIFSSRFRKMEVREFTPFTIEDLVTGRITGHLNFKKKK